MVVIFGRLKRWLQAIAIYWMWCSLLVQGRCCKFFGPFRNSSSIETFFCTSNVMLFTRWGKKNKDANHHHNGREKSNWPIRRVILEFCLLCWTLRWIPKLTQPRGSSIYTLESDNIFACYVECNFSYRVQNTNKQAFFGYFKALSQKLRFLLLHIYSFILRNQEDLHLSFIKFLETLYVCK